MTKLENHQERQVRLLEAKLANRWNLMRTVNVGTEAPKILHEIDDLESRIRIAKSAK